MDADFARAKAAAYMREYRKRNPEKLRAIDAATKARNRDKVLARKAEYRRKQGGKVLAYNAAYRERNREKDREWKRAYAKKNPHVYREARARRRATEISATPAWADVMKIQGVYAECLRRSTETGVRHHVDHIVPLQGRHVCGLHVYENLRVIPWHENARKSNKWGP